MTSSLGSSHQLSISPYPANFCVISRGLTESMFDETINRPVDSLDSHLADNEAVVMIGKFQMAWKYDAAQIYKKQLTRNQEFSAFYTETIKASRIFVIAM